MVEVRNLVLAIGALLVVKFCVIAFWMQDQQHQRAARVNLVAALLVIVGGVVFAFGLELAAYLAALVAIALGISSFRLVRTGRG